MLQCVAIRGSTFELAKQVCCSVLQSVVAECCCSVLLQCVVAVCCSVLQYKSLSSSSQRCVAVCCSVLLQCAVAVCFGVLLYEAPLPGSQSKAYTQASKKIIFAERESPIKYKRPLLQI